MAQQLVFTSAPSGLKPGSRGFTTVGASSNMSPPLMSRLESLSGYQLAYNLSDPQAHLNPVCFSHIRLEVAGTTINVISRIAPAGADYSGRSNTIAHHVVIDPAERSPAGPAAMLAHPGWLIDAWSGPPRYLDAPVPFPRADPNPRPCATWEALAGDAGWGGALAGAFTRAAHQPAYLIYTPGTDVLALLRESMALLPPDRRWEVTFSTYFTAVTPGVTCQWRCVLAGTPAARALSRAPGTLILDLTKPLGQPEANLYTDAARAGRIAQTVAAPAPVPIEEPEPVAVEPAVAPKARRATIPPPVLAAARVTQPAGVSERQAYDLAGPVLPNEEHDLGPNMLRPPAVPRRSRGWFAVVVAAACLGLGAGIGVIVTLTVSRPSSTSTRTTEKPQATGKPLETPQATGKPLETPQATGKPSEAPQATGKPLETPQATGKPLETPPAPPANDTSLAERSQTAPPPATQPTTQPKTSQQPATSSPSTAPSGTPHAAPPASVASPATDKPGEYPALRRLRRTLRSLKELHDPNTEQPEVVPIKLAINTEIGLEFVPDVYTYYQPDNIAGKATEGCLDLLPASWGEKNDRSPLAKIQFFEPRSTDKGFGVLVRTVIQQGISAQQLRDVRIGLDAKNGNTAIRYILFFPEAYEVKQDIKVKLPKDRVELTCLNAKYVSPQFPIRDNRVSATGPPQNMVVIFDTKSYNELIVAFGKLVKGSGKGTRGTDPPVESYGWDGLVQKKNAAQSELKTLSTTIDKNDQRYKTAKNEMEKWEKAVESRAGELRTKHKEIVKAINRLKEDIEAIGPIEFQDQFRVPIASIKITIEATQPLPALPPDVSE